MHSLSLSLTLPLLIALSTTTTLAQNASSSTPSSSSSSSSPSPANITITVYSLPACNQTGPAFTVPLPYNQQTTNFNNNSMPILSYTLSRATTPHEQLDFSGPTRGMGVLHGDPQQCTLFHETTSPDSNGNPLAAGTCYGLLNGPAECLRFFPIG